MVNKLTVKKKINVSRGLFFAVHLALGMFMVAVFYFYANIKSFVMAFQRTEDGVLVWTMANFGYFFDSLKEGGIMKEAFLNTFFWFLVNTILRHIGMFTSYFLYKKIFLHKFYRIVFFLPSLISAVIMAYIIDRITGTQGIIAKMVQKIDHLDYVPELLVESRYVMKTLFVNSAVFSIASGMLIWCGSMSRIPESVIESAKLDGTNWFQEMFLIVLPCILPTVAISLCTSIATLFAANGGEFLYTRGEHGTMTFSTWQYLQIYNTGIESNSHNLVSAIGWLVTIVTVPIVLMTRKLSRLVGEVEY